MKIRQTGNSSLPEEKRKEMKIKLFVILLAGVVVSLFIGSNFAGEKTPQKGDESVTFEFFEDDFGKEFIVKKKTSVEDVAVSERPEKLFRPEISSLLTGGEKNITKKDCESFFSGFFPEIKTEVRCVEKTFLHQPTEGDVYHIQADDKKLPLSESRVKWFVWVAIGGIIFLWFICIVYQVKTKCFARYAGAIMAMTIFILIVNMSLYFIDMKAGPSIYMAYTIFGVSSSLTLIAIGCCVYFIVTINKWEAKKKLNAGAWRFSTRVVISLSSWIAVPVIVGLMSACISVDIAQGQISGTVVVEWIWYLFTWLASLTFVLMATNQILPIIIPIKRGIGKKIVMPVYGNSFEVDITDDACSWFGVKHGDHIINDVNKVEGIVVGVAGFNCGEGEEVLWCAFEGDDGKVSYGTRGHFSKIDQ